MKNSIRRRLIILFLCCSGILCFVMTSVAIAFIFLGKLVADSYDSNNSIKSYKTLVVRVENALERYINLKNYENIDVYFQARAKLELETLYFSQTPSDSSIKNCEYLVSKFSESFLNYSDMAVYERRAGNISVSEENLEHVFKTYSLLMNKIDELNQLYFEENISSYSLRQKLIDQVVFFGLAFVIFVVLVTIIAVYFFVTNVTQPLVEISKKANQLAERNFEIPLFEYNKHDEIGNICRAFNRMIISIKEYVDTIWEKAIKENELKEKEMKMMELYQDAKLNALQSQINPHFLFNTLNTGAQLAMMEGSDRTCDFLEKVADFYRYNLQFTGQESDIESEIHLLESYCYIMKVRFGDRFDFLTDIRSSKLQTGIPGMILQPLVENCIKHGLAEITNGGKIILSVSEEENDVIVAISDNGCGFPDEKRQNILEGIYGISENIINFNSKDSGTGVGLMNVISRLKMYYKCDEVFDIQKSEFGGTKFLIRIRNGGKNV